jgi:aldose 1-epimerase
MTEDAFVTLNAGPSRLQLWPEIGGAVVDWRFEDIALLRPIPEEAMAARSARRLGCFPLVPYSNRIAGARLTFGGVTYPLRPDANGEPHSIHGNGWYSPWSVVEKEAARLVLALDHAPEGDRALDWPFAYRATQTFTLGEAGLVISLHIENRDSRPMPAGFGLHPYFRRSKATQLTYCASSVWLNGADRLPSDSIAVPPEWSFAKGRSPAAVALDHCFAGWDGVARIVWPEDRLGLSIEASPAFSHLVVYTPAGRDFFCVEPVSHMNDGMSRLASQEGHGVAILGPGDVLEGDVRFRLDRLA